MNPIKGPRKIFIASFADLTLKLVRMLYLPTFFMTFRNTDPLFREKVLLTVSISNECGG